MKQPITIAIFLCCSISTSSFVVGDELLLTESNDTVRVTLGDKPVLEYVKTARPVPNGIEKHFSRNGYIHPVYAPSGHEITGDYPADHAHQHALFFAWTKCAFNGEKVDFWNQAKGLGRIEFRKVLNTTQKPNSVSFSVKHAFMVKLNENWTDVLDEVWTVTIHATPEDHFLFDIESVQQCVTDKPLSLAEYRYGGMAFRGNYQWLKQKDDHSIQPGGIRYLTSEGKDRWDGNHTRPNWVAFSGKIDGQDVSTIVFCSPKNFRAPQPVRIHPNKPYFCFAPMVDAAFKIKPGKKYVSRYRYLVTADAMDEELIRRHWNEYAAAEK